MEKEFIRIGDVEKSIEIVDYNSAIYPYLLRNIKNPPRKLYCAGDLSALEDTCVGVVGSRKYTVYGKEVSRMVGRRLSEAGIAVVSGLANGIDGYAHEGALERGGRPIAVLGSGLRQMYPRNHLKLMQSVMEKGLVISEFEPDFKGQAWSFPMRNRIISGLSEAVVVIEANVNSGALITAQFAAEQGRRLYAVPGNINSQFSVGTNQLIRDGATPLIVIDDILTDLGVPVPDVEDVVLGLKDDENDIVNVLRKESGLGVDSIAGRLGRRPASVNSMLTILEIKGIVVSNAGKFYLAKG